jgi:hypothetical protein
MIENENKLAPNPVDQHILDNYLIVTTVNKNYLKIFDIWYHFFKTSAYTSILRVITFDKKSEGYISKKQIRTIHPGKSTNSFAKLIQWRFEEIEKLIEKGKSIIQTDADAFWINPKIEHVVNEKFDIQCSISYGIPPKSVERWGFTLCTGFMIIQSNCTVKKLMKNWIKEISRVKDDQVAFNNLILKNNPKWELKNVERNHCFCTKDTIYLEAIDTNLVSRTFKQDMLIFHPFLDSNHQLKKIKILSEKFNNNEIGDQTIDQYFSSELNNALNWVIATIGCLNVVFYKFVKKMKR